MKTLSLQAKHLASQYWGSSHTAAARRDPSLPYLEQYRIAASQFQELFACLTPWACGTHTPVLAGRMFRLLDKNKDSLINFKEFVTGMSECLLEPDPDLAFSHGIPGQSVLPSLVGLGQLAAGKAELAWRYSEEAWDWLPGPLQL